MRDPVRRPRKLGTSSEQDATTHVLYWWLLAAIFLEYARPLGFVPGIRALPLNSLVPLSLLAVCLFARGLRSFEEIFKDPMSKWVFIYCALIALSMAHAAVTFNAYFVFKLVLGYLFLFIMIVRIVTSRRRLLGVYATLAAAHVFLLAMNPEVLLNSEVRSYIQGSTFMGDGNDFSLSICILVPMVVQLAIAAKSGYRRLVWSSVVVVLMVALVNTASRGATLAIAAVAAYLWLVSPRKMLTLAAVLLAVGAILLYASDMYFERMGTIVNYQEEGSAMGRITAWKAGMRMFADNPLLGVGAGHFPIAFGTTYKPTGLDGAMPWLTAHSMYVLILGELGLPGVVTFLTLIIGNFMLNSALRRRLLLVASENEQAAMRDSAMMIYMLNASTIGFAVAGAFLSVAYYPHIFVLTALAVSLRRIVAPAIANRAVGPVTLLRHSPTGGNRTGPLAVSKAEYRGGSPERDHPIKIGSK